MTSPGPKKDRPLSNARKAHIKDFTDSLNREEINFLVGCAANRITVIMKDILSPEFEKMKAFMERPEFKQLVADTRQRMKEAGVLDGISRSEGATGDVPGNGEVAKESGPRSEE